MFKNRHRQTTIALLVKKKTVKQIKKNNGTIRDNTSIEQEKIISVGRLTTKKCLIKFKKNSDQLDTYLFLE